MRDSWVCRDYRSGDEYQVLSLYREVNNKEMTLELWRWKFVERPFGKGIVKLMFDGKKLIGHYAVVPVCLQVGNETVKAIFSLNTMTHPEYQKQGVFAYLAEQVYGECRRDGFALVYGFPNENSYHGFTSRLRWTGFGRMRTWQKELRSDSTVPRYRNVHEVSRFGDEVTSLWNEVKSDYNVVVPRLRDFLNWRFVNHPTGTYSRYATIDSCDRMLGYLVLKTYAGECEPKGHIVDILCVENKDVIKSLLACTYKHFIGKGIRYLSCWLPDNCFCARVLREEGFTARESATSFGVRVIGREDGSLQTIGRLDSWYLTMGDSDVF